MKILALDMSSTAIGVCLDGVSQPTIKLPSPDIANRCQLAARSVLALLDQADVDFVVIESPVARFAKAVIPQARVSGAVLAVINALGMAWVELAPKTAKKALTGKGNASKAEMIAAAQAIMLARGEIDEHQADAVGLWLAANRIDARKEAA